MPELLGRHRRGAVKADEAPAPKGRKRSNAIRGGAPPMLGIPGGMDAMQTAGNAAVSEAITNESMGRAMSDALDRMTANTPLAEPEYERSTANAGAAPTAVKTDKPRYHIWPSKEMQQLDLLRQGKLKLPKAQVKEIRAKEAKARKDAQGMWEICETVFADTPQVLDKANMRVDAPYPLQMLKDIGVGPAFFTFSEAGANDAEAVAREINANELAKSRMKQVGDDNKADGDRYDADYDSWILDELEDKLKQAEKDKQVKEVLDASKGGNQGMIISESHGDVGSWRFLYEQIPSMRADDVMTIYLEHFRNSEYQPLLDAYYAAPEAEMPVALASYIKKFDANHKLKGKYSLMGVVVRAKEHGLRVVGIDDAAAKRGSEVVTGDQLESRAARMNVIAEAIVAADQQRFGKHKFVMLMGAKHTHDHETGSGTEFPDGIAGVAQLLNLIAVKVGDDDKLTLHRRGED